MKLDRNKNADGRGKYALIELRKVTEQQYEELLNVEDSPHDHAHVPGKAIHTGNGGPGEQFFVLKYKDKFAAAALRAYANAVRAEAGLCKKDTGFDDLTEFAIEIEREAAIAEKAGNQIPT